MYSCGHEIQTTTVCHSHRENHSRGIEADYYDDFIDNPMKEDFVCDECREEPEVELTKETELPRMVRDGDEEETLDEEEEDEQTDDEEWEDEEFVINLEQMAEEHGK